MNGRKTFTILMFAIVLLAATSGLLRTIVNEGKGSNRSARRPAAGGLIGTAVGHPGIGAELGNLGLGAGALIGDQLQGQQQTQYQQQQQIDEKMRPNSSANGNK